MIILRTVQLCCNFVLVLLFIADASQRPSVSSSCRSTWLEKEGPGHDAQVLACGKKLRMG
jgi:hypothetical protein